MLGLALVNIGFSRCFPLALCTFSLTDFARLITHINIMLLLDPVVFVSFYHFNASHGVYYLILIDQ